MCGIAGYHLFRPGPPPPPGALEAMTGALRHRGPDEEGFLRRGGTGLGIRRLSILDLEGGSQPIGNERGNVWTVYNGEIYNHGELRAELERAGHRFRTRTDTEVVVHAYEEWGDAFLARLRGMFAFALWDEVYGKLMLVRDPLGVKPAYYTTLQGTLLFASEVKALLAVDGVPRRLDLRQVLTFLTLQYVPSPDTLLRGVRKVPPGHVLICQKGRLAVRPYRTLEELPDPTPDLPADAPIGAFADRLRGLFEASVREQRLADVPVGALLSGGIDSSFLVGTLARTGGALRTYSVGFPGGTAFNELRHARRVARHFGCPHREMTVDASLLPELLPRLAKSQADPVADPALLPTFLVSLFARQEVKVVLTGEGADELFGGYRRYAWDRHHGTFRRLPGPLRAALAALASRISERHRQGVEALGEEDPVRRHLAWVRLGLPSTLRRVAGEALRFEWERHSVEESLARAYEEGAADPDPLNCILRVDLKTWLPDDLLAKVDRMSMAASLEARVPYLDERLVAFALRIPGRYKIRGGVQKAVLKEAARDTVPGWVLRRPKQGFAVPLAPWFRRELRPLLQDTLAPDRLKRRGLFDPEGVRRVVEEHLSGREDHHLLLFGMLLLEWWQEDS